MPRRVPEAALDPRRNSGGKGACVENAAGRHPRRGNARGRRMQKLGIVKSTMQAHVPVGKVAHLQHERAHEHCRSRTRRQDCGQRTDRRRDDRVGDRPEEARRRPEYTRVANVREEVEHDAIARNVTRGLNENAVSPAATRSRAGSMRARRAERLSRRESRRGRISATAPRRGYGKPPIPVQRWTTAARAKTATAHQG